MKRILSLVLAALMLASLLPMAAFAADENMFVPGADSADMLAGGGRILHADGKTYFSENGAVLVSGGGEPSVLLNEDAGNLNACDGALYFTRSRGDCFDICRFNGSVTEVLLAAVPGEAKQMYVVNGTDFYWLSEGAIRKHANGVTELLLSDEALFAFVPTPYGLVYALGTALDFSLFAGDTEITCFADRFSVDLEADGGRIVFHDRSGDRQTDLKSAFGGRVVPEKYTGFGEVDVSAMLSAEYNEDEREIAEEERTARNAANSPKRAFNGAQGNPDALRGTLTQGQQNAQRRAYQMTDIEWKPKANVLGWNSGLTYTAGTTYKGLPYGQPVNASYVPWSTDLTTFIAKVNDSSSKMYTDYSAYNKRAPYYSTDCSAFVSWALNMGSRQTTSGIANKGTLISSSSYAGIQVGDYLNNAGSHVVICTDITYDTGGAITGIEISEATVVAATKYCCQRTWYGAGFANSLSYFTTKYFGGGYSLYRSNTIASVPYSHVCVSPVSGDVCSTCGYGVSSGGTGSSGGDSGTKFGIDVSSHQGTINWDAVAPQIDFAILRVGYGSDMTSQDDTQWANNIAACERLNIPYGVYIYSYANTTAKAASEAQHVIRLLQGHNPALPVFYDLEDAAVSACGSAAIYSYATIFCNAIEAAGYLPGVYANLNWWRNYLTDPGYDQWYRWVAQYNSTCTYNGTYCMWQNSSSYTMSGISANTVDTDYWYGAFPGGGTSQPSGTYTVTYKVPADYTEIAPAAVTAGNSVTLPAVSTRVCGYTFMGWTTSAVSATTTRPEFYYAGQSFTPAKNTTLRAVFSYYKDGSTVKGDIYYPACSASQTGLAAALSESGAASTTLAYRRDYVAAVNFVYNYSGTAAQNTAMLNLLKAGMLVNPEAVTNYTAYYNTTPGVCKRSTTTTTLAATCTAAGSKLTSCAYCGYSKTTAISPLGHSYATVITAPTCSAGGYTTYTCSRCGDSYVGDDVPPGDHTLSCADLGNGTHKQYCTVCGTVIATGAHTYVNNYCTLCGAYNPNTDYSGTYYIAAKRTNDTNWHYLTNAIVSSRYAIEDSGLTELPGAIASPAADKAFTLTKNGDGTYLLRSEGIYNGQSYLGWTSGNTGAFVAQTNAIHAAVTGQQDGTVQISFTDTSSATRYLAFNSTATNKYAAWYSAQLKNLHLIPVTGSVPAHTHDYASEVTTQPTCTAAGVRTYTCALCGDTYTEPVAALQHDYVYHVTNPTCTDRGYTRATCSRCDYDEILDYTYTAALGHDWRQGTPVAPTCTEEGYTPLECSRCGATDLENITNAPGHAYAYADNGNGTHRYYCSRCNTTFDAAELCVYENGVCIGCGHEKATASYGDFERVTEAPADWSGLYLIVCENNSTAFNGSLSTPNVKMNYNAVTIADGVIDGNNTVKSWAVTVEKVSGTNYYTILLGSGKYMGSTGSSTGISATSTKYQNAISLDASGNAVIANTSGTNTYNVRFNTGSTSDRFAFYGASTGYPVKLYRYIECPHSYDSGAVTAPATCTQPGVKTYTCGLCGETYTEPVPATGHSYVYGAEQNGVVTGTCGSCGDTVYRYRVTYSVPGFAAAPASVLMDAGSSIEALPETDTIPGYVLMGWTAAPVSGTETEPAFYQKGSPYTVSGACTLYACYACWKDNGELTADIYYPACASTYSSIYYALESVAPGTGSLSYRENSIASVMYIYNYTGSTAQNNALVALLKAGLLVDPAKVSGYTEYYTTEPGEIHTHTPVLTGAVAATCAEAGRSAYYTCTGCGRFFSDAACENEIAENSWILPALGHSMTAVPAVPATCTESGLTAGSRCTRCDYAVSGSAVAALGHDYTCTDDGNGTTHTVGCSRCGYSATENHSFEGGVCVCGAAEPVEVPEIKSASLTLDEDIDFTYAVAVPAGYENPYMTFTMHGVTRTVTDYTVKNGQLCFRFPGVTPQCMGDGITAVFHAEKGGRDYTDTVAGYSVRQYCVNRLAANPDNAALKTLLSDMLVYGAAAQTYTGYRTDALVTDGLELTPSAFSPVSGKAVSFSGAADGADWSGATLVLKNTLAVRFFFTAESVDGLTVTASLNGRAQSFNADDFILWNEETNLYCFDYSGIEANEFDDAVTAGFAIGGAPAGRTVSYSVNAYVCGTQNAENATLQALVRALYNYGASASAYAG